MVNSRQLSEVVASSLGRPYTATLQHARNLRETKGSKDGPLLSAGGRGRNAPAMTHEDAAALLCAILGSENVQDSVKTVEAMRELEANFQGQRGSMLRNGIVPFDTGIRREHNVIEALAAVLRFFDGEQEIVRRFHPYDEELHVLFEVEYPLHYAFITVGVRKKFWETWTYGRKKEVRNEQLRRCRQDAMREISHALRSTGADGAKLEGDR
ncbi:hypothetical protein [Bradyrhizobium sp. 26S5]|uniref:hypothetical protein n=1 Tax=Bradyrhizobium sp. 26S5 TaxID=3139729 RepID=UPI0030CCEBD7